MSHKNARDGLLRFLEVLDELDVGGYFSAAVKKARLAVGAR